MLWPTQIHPSLRRKPEGFFAFQVLENNQRICHPERAQRVEGSSTFAPQYGQITGKILRLRASRSAQDDIRFCDSSVYRIWALDSHEQLTMRIKSLNTEDAEISEPYVILSGARSAQSKDLSRDLTVLRGEGRRSFDSLRSLRMTTFFLSSLVS